MSQTALIEDLYDLAFGLFNAELITLHTKPVRHTQKKTQRIVIFLKILFPPSNTSHTQQLISKATFDMINYFCGCRVDFSFCSFLHCCRFSSPQKVCINDCFQVESFFSLFNHTHYSRKKNIPFANKLPQR